MSSLNIKKISELAGVSTAAVSYVLNNKPGVSEATRKRVLEIIERENYIPNLNSRRLILKRSFNLYVVIDEQATSFDNMFYSSVMKAIVEKSTALGYSIVLSTRSAPFSDSTAARAIQQGNVDGILFMQDINNDIFFFLKQTETPFVVVDSHKLQPEYPCVRVDYELATYTATSHLIGRGHTKIAYIGTESIPDFYVSTFSGYNRALSEHGLTFHPNWLKGGAVDMASARSCMQEILEGGVPPTAVLCVGDALAIGAMNCAREHGLHLPGDISFCGIDDILIAECCYPPLDTIHIDKQEMGEAAVRKLDEQVKGNAPDTVHTVRSDQLIVRESVGSPQ